MRMRIYKNGGRVIFKNNIGHFLKVVCYSSSVCKIIWEEPLKDVPGNSCS